MDVRDTFAKNLFRLRKARKLSQEELGFRVGLDRTSISNLERRKHAPTLENSVKLAQALDVDIHDLIRPIAPGLRSEPEQSSEDRS